jgi:hypothetical protein
MIEFRVTIICFAMALGADAGASPLPQAQVQTGGAWLDVGCRTLDSIDDYVVNPTNMVFSKYGGWKARQVAATGFFRVEKIDGRWWAVDPEGYLYIHKAPNSIHLDDFTADEIYQLLPQYGFNGTGSWTDEALFDSPLKEQAPLAYCPKISFIALYRRDRDPRIEMPVFDAAFETYCNQKALEFSPYVNDPHVFGYFSDNELSWRDDGLPAHLDINDPSDANYATAVAFLADRGKTPSNWNTDDQYAYMAVMAERYYSVVSAAIKNVDPNHMYIGSRCHSTEKTVQAFMENAGKYVDIFTMNHYHRWGARKVEIANMAEWSGRPLMVTEFYAMQLLTGDEFGAGWRVQDQPSRGLFYQNFVSTLAETKNVVGWHWFKFQDDENGNKGMVDVDGNLYTNLLGRMEQMNTQIYNFIDYVDSQPVPDISALPEADAYFKGTINYGGDPELWVKNASASVYREAYLRFGLPVAAPTDIASATIHVRSVAAGSESGNFQAELVVDNSWEEMSLTISNHPPGSTVLASWSDGDDVSLDVTDVLRDTLATGNQLSIRIICLLNNGSIARYGAREHSNSNAWPRLEIVYAPGRKAYDVWTLAEGLQAGINDGRGDDPEFDGMDNFLEFALGANPLAPDSGTFLPYSGWSNESGSNFFHCVHRRRIDHEALGLDYVVGSGTDLSAHPPTNPVPEAGSTVLDAAFESVTNRVPMDAEACQFMQLRVDINP